MKKQTVHAWILRQKNVTLGKEKQEALRAAKVAALEQCEIWLFDLAWATMREPVRNKRDALNQQARLLMEHAKQEPLSEEEATHLDEQRASSEIYTLFLHKITPTARQAEMEHDASQREHAERHHHLTNETKRPLSPLD